MKLSTLARRNGGEHLGPDQEFSAVSTDSRSIETGDLFFALRGENFDGHKFAKSANEGGACALVVEKAMPNIAATQLVVDDSVLALGQCGALNREVFAGKIFAVTGSNGKTTVKGMLHSIMSEYCPTLATHGNFNNHIGVPLTLMRLSKNVDAAVIEAGTNAKGEIEYLASLIQPDVALVNNVMPAHLLGFGTELSIAEEKAEIYSGRNLKVGVVNLDSRYKNIFLSRLEGKRVIGFRVIDMQAPSNDSKNDISAESTECLTAYCGSDSNTGLVQASLQWEGIQYPMTLNVLGDHNIGNAAAAAACALAADVPMEKIIAGLEKFETSPGRMQSKASAKCARLIDDTYNANPSSMKAAIDYLSRFKNSVLVMGDMGEIGEGEITAHIQVGEYAKQQGIEQLIGIGPLSKNAVEAFGESALSFTDYEQAYDFISDIDWTDFNVLIKGSRGSRMERVVEQLEQIEEIG